MRLKIFIYFIKTFVPHNKGFIFLKNNMIKWLNVLSLFDWMSCWMLALEKCWIKVNRYFASEIDKYAIKVSQDNYKEIVHIWDIKNISFNKCLSYNNWIKITRCEITNIDLLIWWSPCQWFSRAWKWLNFEDNRSRLFFEYVRLLKEIKPKYFLLENVNMKKEWEDIITEILWVEPIKINSSLFIPHDRPRTYWTNIIIDKNIKQKKYILNDFLKAENSETKYINDNLFNNLVLSKKENSLKIRNATKKWFLEWVEWNCVDVSFPTSNSRRWRVKVNKIWCLSTSLNQTIITKDLRIRYLSPNECELLQWIPEWYSDIVSNNQRYRMLWNGWTVDVIAYICYYIKVF